MAQRKSRSPYSVSKYNTAVCQGFSYMANQLFFYMNVPSSIVTGKTSPDSKVGHMIIQAYDKDDDIWVNANTTGFSEDEKNAQRNYKNDLDQCLDFIIPQELIDYEIKNKDGYKNLYELY